MDHNLRRDEVATLATALIARGGVDAATVRDIAAAGGYSTKVVSRYFSDKRELLVLVYRAAAERARHRLMDARSARGDDVLACTDALLPLDEDEQLALVGEVAAHDLGAVATGRGDVAHGRGVDAAPGDEGCGQRRHLVPAQVVIHRTGHLGSVSGGWRLT